MEKMKILFQLKEMRENHITSFPFPFSVFTPFYASLNTDLEYIWLLNGQNANNDVNCGFPVKLMTYCHNGTDSGL